MRAPRKGSPQLAKKVFDKLADGGAGSPAAVTPTSFC